MIRGHVLYADGSPAIGTVIAVGDERRTVGPTGRFFLSTKLLGPGVGLVAARRDFAPVVVPDVLTRAAAGPLVLTVDDPPTCIEGRVVDVRGEPLAGWVVELATGTDVGPRKGPRQFAEDVAVAILEPKPVQAAQERARRGLPSTSPNMQLTQKDGSFVLKGLLAGRDYTVKASDPGSLREITSDPIAAGYHTALLVARPGAGRLVSGTVRDRSGQVLAGVDVAVTRRKPPPGTKHMGWTTTTTTDAGGRFTLAGTPHIDLVLHFSADAIQPESLDLPVTEASDNLDVRVTAIRLVRLQLTQKRSFHFAEFLDDGGERRGSQVFTSAAHTGTVEFEAPETATFVTLSSEKGEVWRAPLHLASGSVTDLRW